MSSHLPIDRAAVSEFCERHHIPRLALFGSVIRDDFRPESDIDVLVEFQPGIRVGLAFIQMQDERVERGYGSPAGRVGSASAVA